LAPLIFLIYLIIDIKIDSKRLLWLYQRPVPLKAKNIGKIVNTMLFFLLSLIYQSFYLKGIFKKLINFINFCAIINNGVLVIFSSNYFKKDKDKTGKLEFFIYFQVRFSIMSNKYQYLSTIQILIIKEYLFEYWQYILFKIFSRDRKLGFNIK
jgi:hypothetical protein